MNIRIFASIAILAILTLLGNIPAGAQRTTRERRGPKVQHTKVGHHFQPRDEPVAVYKKRPHRHPAHVKAKHHPVTHHAHRVHHRKHYRPRKLTND